MTNLFKYSLLFIECNVHFTYLIKLMVFQHGLSLGVIYIFSVSLKMLEKCTCASYHLFLLLHPEVCLKLESFFHINKIYFISDSRVIFL